MLSPNQAHLDRIAKTEVHIVSQFYLAMGQSKPPYQYKLELSDTRMDEQLEALRRFTERAIKLGWAVLTTEGRTSQADRGDPCHYIHISVLDPNDEKFASNKTTPTPEPEKQENDQPAPRQFQGKESPKKSFWSRLFGGFGGVGPQDPESVRILAENRLRQINNRS